MIFTSHVMPTCYDCYAQLLCPLYYDYHVFILVEQTTLLQRSTALQAMKSRSERRPGRLGGRWAVGAEVM